MSESQQKPDWSQFHFFTWGSPPCHPEKELTLFMMSNKMTSIPLTNLWLMLCNHTQQMLAMCDFLFLSL